MRNTAPRMVRTYDIRAARAELGDLWGLGRHLTVGEMARVLRLRGNRADETVLDYESGKTEPSGPVTLALDLMLEPSGARIDSAIAAIKEISAHPTAPTFGELIVRHFGADADALLEDIVLTVSDAVRRPNDVAAAVLKTRFHQRDPRHVTLELIDVRRRQRKA